ncbi:MAG: cytochrome C oxidase subunit IV family protein [Deltaproteobacteria bacterium]|nr:cytochrome C oxidase subunit IV family protein [Deltaproteobacteria bacterium]
MVTHHDAPRAHVLPKKLYFAVLGALLVLTLVTVVTAQVHLGPLNLPLAMFIAATKATLVLAVFMHLYWDSKFNLMVFMSSVLFLSVFIILTLLDTEGRSILEPVRQNFRPRDEAVQQRRLQTHDANAELRPGEALGRTEGKTNFERKHAEPH